MSATPRCGIGYDAHRLVAGRRLVLGGVEIADAELGLLGHSDADALAHAVIDALLGAAGLGDIGERYPDDDERFRGADSIALLRDTVAAVRAAGFVPVNVDATVVCEAPRLAPYRDEMRARLAQVLGVSLDRVNVKFTRGEGMGFIGRGEGVAALAVATVAPAS